MAQEDVAYTVMLPVAWPDLVPSVQGTSLPGEAMGPLHLTMGPCFLAGKHTQKGWEASPVYSKKMFVHCLDTETI